MYRVLRPKWALLIALAGWAISSASFAAGSVYKYNDGASVIYQDRPPASSQDDGHSVLNRQGVTLRNIPSRDERARLRAEREAAHRQHIRDRALLATFWNEDDLIRTHENRLGMIDGLINQLDDRVQVLTSRLSTVDSRIASQESNGGSAQVSLYSERRRILRNIENTWSLVNSKAAERTSLMGKFNSDLARYREIKSKR